MTVLTSPGDWKLLKRRFSQRLSMIWSGDGLTHAHATFLFALIFWVSTYCVFSIRSVLFPPIGADLFSSKRLLTTFVGALLFFLALAGTKRFPAKGKGRGYLPIIASSIVASSVLLLFRIGFNELAEPDTFGLADQGRWVLVWGGYFLGGLALYSPETSVPALEPSATPASGIEKETSNVLWLQRNKLLIKVPVSQIEWIEAQGNYVYAHAGETGGLLRASLSSLQEKLEANGFIRVHRSALCQKFHVQGLRRTSDGALMLILASGAELPVGRHYSTDVTAIMSN